MPRQLSGTLDKVRPRIYKLPGRPQSPPGVMRPERKSIDSENEQIYRGLL